MPLAEFIWDRAPKQVQDWMDKRGLAPDSRFEPLKETPTPAAAPDRDYAKDSQMPWDKVVDKIERSAADNLDSGGRIERVEKPIPNPTLDRDLDQPRLSLKL